MGRARRSQEAVAGLVLAGGAGTRFAGPKQLARFRGRPLLEHCLSAMAASPLDPVIVVLGAEHEQVLAEVSLHGAQPVVCREWNQGLGQSLRTGIEHLPDAEAVVVALGDQPLLSPQSIDRLVSARGRDTVAVRASYGGRAGHPVLLEQELLQRAIELKGDVGASSLLALGRVREVPCDGLGSDLDIDTPEQLRALEKPVDPHAVAP